LSAKHESTKETKSSDEAVLEKPIEPAIENKALAAKIADAKAADAKAWWDWKRFNADKGIQKEEKSAAKIASADASSIEHTITKKTEDGSTVEYHVKEIVPVPAVADIKPVAAPIASSTPVASNAAPKALEANAYAHDKMADAKSSASDKPAADSSKLSNNLAFNNLAPSASGKPMTVASLTPANQVISAITKTADTQEGKPVAGAISAPIAALLSIDFHDNDTMISDSDKTRISQLVQKVASGTQRIKVVSYAKGQDSQANSARRISLQRAIAIRAQLIQAGLDSIRINVQAVGDKNEDPSNANKAQIFLVEGNS
jgi:outer membrane protein OmpA-like peptidoglycan-associated protein